MKELIHFCERAQCFDNNAKLKVILFSAGLKSSTYVALRVTPKNMDDRMHFEKHLKQYNVHFSRNRGKAFEEIVRVTKNKAVWRVKGTWYGYDLFKDEKTKKLFAKYVSLVTKHDHVKADQLAGKLYNYPACCIRNFIKEHNLKYVRKKYTYYQYYKRLHDLDRKFPFVTHTACSVSCAASRALNTRYRTALKKLAPRFWKDYTKKRTLATDFIVDAENELYYDPLLEQEPVWPKKNGHEYSLLATKPLQGHYYLFAYLTKKTYERRTVLAGKATLQYDYANISIRREKGVLPSFHHERKLLGRK